MKLTIYPLTLDRLPALEDLFGEQRVVNCCWCMYWRIGSDYRKRPREANYALRFPKIGSKGCCCPLLPIFRSDLTF
jgi:hypothetical protein